MRYPIFLIDNHYIIKIYNLLFLLKTCSYNRNNKKRINQNNIKYLYFLLNNKIFLENIRLNNINKDISEKAKLNFYDFFKDEEVKIVIKFCIVANLVEIEYRCGEIFFSLTNKGDEEISKLGKKFYYSDEDIKILKKLSSYTIKELNDLFLELN